MWQVIINEVGFILCNNIKSAQHHIIIVEYRDCVYTVNRRGQWDFDEGTTVAATIVASLCQAGRSR